MALSVKDILESHINRRPVIVGVLNVTPDSFSDGGRYFSPQAATDHARRMLAAGADVIDVGAESTRPESDRVSADEQIDRLKDILPAVTRTEAVVSIDTTSAKVAGFALDAGAAIINDISAGRDDPDMFALAAERAEAMVLMHMLGEPKTMQENPQYRDVVAEVRDFLSGRIDAATAAGVEENKLIIDPGIGFGKKLGHNLSLIARLDELAELGRPIMLGTSRKRFIGHITGQDLPQGRLGGTIATCLAGWRRGASIFRVHDVEQVGQAFQVSAAIDGVKSI